MMKYGSGQNWGQKSMLYWGLLWRMDGFEVRESGNRQLCRLSGFDGLPISGSECVVLNGLKSYGN